MVTVQVYRKPTSKNSLLHASSCHHKHLIRADPKGLFVWLKCNCSTLTEFEEEADAIEYLFQERGYIRYVVNQARASASDTFRETLLQGKKSLTFPPGIDTTSVVFSTRYSNQFFNIKHILSQYLPILYGDSEYKVILSKGVKYIIKKHAQ